MARDRAQRLLLMLEREHGWLTASAIASALECSPRTVKADVSSLNTRYPGIIDSGSKGYRIGDASLLDKALDKHDGDLPQTANERKSFILRKLLMRHSRVALSDLADELAISSTTLDNELAAIRAEMSEYGLTLKTRAGLLFVSGGETKEKKMLSRLIFEETKDFFVPYVIFGGINGTIPYWMMHFGLVKCSTFTPPYVGVFLEGFLTNMDYMSLVANGIQLILSILIWYPFFKLYEKRELEKEAEIAEAKSEEKSALSAEDEKLLEDLDLDF